MSGTRILAQPASTSGTDAIDGPHHTKLQRRAGVVVVVVMEEQIRGSSARRNQSMEGEYWWKGRGSTSLAALIGFVEAPWHCCMLISGVLQLRSKASLKCAGTEPKQNIQGLFHLSLFTNHHIPSRKKILCDPGSYGPMASWRPSWAFDTCCKRISKHLVQTVQHFNPKHTRREIKLQTLGTQITGT
jgi:hypothetical protein